MKKSEFEVFHYKDARFEGVPVHQHDFYEVYFFISGNVEFNVEGKSFHLKKGDILLINPLELHQPRIGPDQSDYERIVLWVDKNYLASLCSNETSLTRCFDNTNPAHSNLLHPSQSQQEFLGARLHEILAESEQKSYGGDLACKAALIRFLLELNRISFYSEKTAESRTAESPLISAVLDHINEHYCEKLSLSSVADEFFVSKYYLSHAFNSVVGTSLQRYVTLKRLTHAKQMLSSGIRPTTTAQNCGFNDYAGFYRAFVSEFGITPKEYQQGK
ncbi:MAG: helix-turn-helix domain-containing protein, partial [Clostridia bacterium]|nr:helix-turn-helix domain-containing protein [Clostridia bacterium]